MGRIAATVRGTTGIVRGSTACGTVGCANRGRIRPPPAACGPRLRTIGRGSYLKRAAIGPMKIQTFLEHHGLASNPFTEEDAGTDPVFKEHCIASAYHPAWDKVYGDPAEPSTAVVFGEKGAGKTAMRLQIARRLAEHNRAHPEARIFVVEYDDFNPFLDRFRDTLARRQQRPDRMLAQWKLWDHMDSILALAVTQLVDRLLGAPRGKPPGEDGPLDASRLDRLQARDLLLLAACYDQSTSETFKGRWHRLRRLLRFRTWRAYWHLALGVAVTAAVFGLTLGLAQWSWLASPWPYLFALAGWVPWLARVFRWFRQARRIVRHVRVSNHETNPLRQVLMNFTADELASQPLPTKDRTDDRYELLIKLQGILRTLGFAGTIVLVDRVDEPHLVNGSADQMRALMWPMLDNKFLKHPGLGFKLLLPIELAHFVQREDREFYQRARLDKQNMIPSLEWTGEALYDVANARLAACAADGRAPALGDLFEESVTPRRLIDALRSLRVPRHLFRFMYRLLVAHANAYTDESPEWKISGGTFESVLALYLRDQDALDRGVGTG
jgi:hypothetical protein